LMDENDPPRWETPGWQVALAAQAPRVAVVGRSPFLWEQKEGRAEVWDLPTRRRLAAPPDFARTAALSPDGLWLALAGHAGLVRVLPVEGGGAPQDLKADGPQHALAFSPDGRWLVSSGRGAA